MRIIPVVVCILVASIFVVSMHGSAFGGFAHDGVCNTLKHIPSNSWKLFLCSTVEINGDVDGITLANTDHFGDSVANIGDLDLDGVNDLAVGAKRDDGGSTDAGSLYILFMNKDGSVKSTAKIEDDDITARGPELATEDRFGDSVVNIGDLNGDGIDDLAVGAPNDDTKSDGTFGGQNWDAGAVYILFLNRDGSLARETVVIDASTRDPDYGPALTKGDAFGMGVANIGDLDGNGYDDLAVGAMLDHNNNRGAVHILFMDENGGLAKATEIIDGSTTNGPTLGNGYWFGGSVANIGDFDGNGVDDLAVGSNLSPGGGSVATGAVYILFMDEDPGNGLAKATVVIDNTTTNGPTLSDDDRFGASIANMGDIDGNGVNDLVVGARGDDEGGSWTGAVHILFMNASGSVEETIEINSSTTHNGPTLSAGDAFGTGLAHIGDLNGNGVNDLVVGTNLDDGDGSDRGIVYILFLTSEIEPRSTDDKRNLNPYLTDEILVSVGPNKAIVTDTDYLPNIQIQKGDSITITLNVADKGPKSETNTFYGQSDIESVSLYTNFGPRPGGMNLYHANHFNDKHESSKTFYEWNANKDNVVYDFTKSVEWHNPVVRTAQFDTSTDDSSIPAEDKLTITFYSTWNEVMPKSEIIVKAVDSQMGYSKTTLPFTLQVGEYNQSYEDLFGTSTDYRFVPFLNDIKVRESIHEWVDPLSGMTDEKFVSSLGLDGDELPGYVKHLAQWVVEDKIDLAELIIAVEYLINLG